MASVWKRLQRVNKRAAKFQYTASYHRIELETTPKWRPNKLSIVWSRRSRRVVSEPQTWEPSLKDPLKGSVVFTAPVNHTVTVTLFRDPRTNELEDKDWTFVLEDVSPSGKRRRLAHCAINMRRHASCLPAQKTLRLPLTPASKRVAAAALHLTLHSSLLREGRATDEDMQSLASLLSVNNNSDIAVLEDLDEDDVTLSDQSARQVFDLRQQMEEMTNSLTTGEIATPNSVQSLAFDSTPTPTTPFPDRDLTPTPDTKAPDKTDNNKPIDKDPPTLESKITKDLSPTYLPQMENNKITKETPKIDETAVADKPKFTSTPKGKDELKSVVFKPKTVAKMNLKPLDLKINFNLDRIDNEKDADKTPTGESKVASFRVERDKTPVQDLLEWCQCVTSEYRSCRVLDLSKSFRSGLAFCAIIHRFRPDLIDFSGLQPEEAEKNVRCALEASASLGIPQVLSVADVCTPPGPDKLAIMTYLFQLRAHFTGSELQVEQLGTSECESSYRVGRHDTDGGVPSELFSREVSERRSRRGPPLHARQESQESKSSQERQSPDKPLSPLKDVRSQLVHHSKNILDRVLSPTKERPTAKWFDNPLTVDETTTQLKQEKSRKDSQAVKGVEESCNGISNGDDVNCNTDDAHPLTNGQLNGDVQYVEELKSPIGNGSIQSPSAELPKPPPKVLSRHDELKEKARRLLEATRREARERDGDMPNHVDKMAADAQQNGDPSPKQLSPEEERQALLRERARKLIADVRAGVVSSATSPSGQRPRIHTQDLVSKQSLISDMSPITSENVNHGTAQSKESTRSNSPISKSGSDSPVKSDERLASKSPSVERAPALQTFSDLIDRLTPDDDNQDESSTQQTYMESELLALEREQSAVDARAAALETRLRRVMAANDDPEEEDRLMSQWFNLVNKKNALLRRQMQLNILEQEADLSKRCELLARELRLSLGVDEWRKTAAQKRRERLLLQELVEAVNERDRLVQEMDEQERAIADDDEIERNLSQVEIQRKNNCILQ